MPSTRANLDSDSSSPAFAIVVAGWDITVDLVALGRVPSAAVVVVKSLAPTLSEVLGAKAPAVFEVEKAGI